MFNKRKMPALFFLAVVYIEVLVIPFVLGYYLMDRADQMSYIGEISHTINTGFLSQSDIYPATFVWASILSLVTNVQINYLTYFISVVITLLFIIGTVVLFRKFISDSDIYNLTLLTAFIFYFSHFHFFPLTPHYFFFSMIPFYLFVFEKYLKNKSVNISIIIVVILILAPFTHPFIFLFLFYFILVAVILRNVLSLEISDLKTALVLLTTTFSFWFVSNTTFLNDLRIFYYNYLQQITEPTFAETVSKLSVINLNFYQFFIFLNFYYGRYYIPTIFIVVSTIIVYKNRKNENMFSKTFVKNYSTLIVISIFLLILESIFFFNKLVAHQPDRLTNLNFLVFAQIPLFAYSLYVIFLRRSSIRNFFVVLIILTSVWTLSFFGIFDSPTIFKPNNAITYNEVYGMKWFYENKVDYPIASAPISQLYRFRDLLAEHRDIFAKDSIDKYKDIPDHFGYVKNNSISTQNFSDINLKKQEQIYLIILTIDELLYQKVPGYDQIGRYTNNDFSRFRNDKSVEKIYQSTNIEIYKSREI
jgi:hypothetical protein